MTCFPAGPPFGQHAAIPFSQAAASFLQSDFAKGQQALALSAQAGVPALHFGSPARAEIAKAITTNVKISLFMASR